jgi:NAD(P)-dependent dehydrogenase (short-subunit alcohol dehydrogenase family)
MNIQGNVLITGASSGIGEVCAISLARLGFRVFAGVREKSAAEKLARLDVENIVPVFIDITNPAMIDEAFELIAEKTGAQGLYGLINNAGIGFGAPIEYIPFEQLKKVFEINVFGQIAMIQKFLPLIRKARGRIVNISSISGRLPQPYQSTYSAAKMALESFSDSLRVELRPWDIRVCVIEPGSVNTPIWNKSIEETWQLFAQYPLSGQELYKPSIEAFLNAANKFYQNSIPPQAVAKAATHALTARTPHTRYIVGKDAILLYYLIKPLPDMMRDWVLARLMGLPKKGSQVS